MTRLRFWAAASLALALAGNSTKAENRGDSLVGSISPAAAAPTPPAASDQGCVIYSLGEMGIDADFGQWVAETIPEVIEPGSWKGAGAIRYYAPKNILVVRHTADVHTKVDGFLKNIKAVRPPEKTSKKTTHGAIVPADYRTPSVLRTSAPIPDQSGYPVPAPVKTPKHLFHFLIRYEGEGIIDDNVVKFMKLQAGGEKKETPAVVPTISSSPSGGYSSAGTPATALPGTTAPSTSAPSGASAAPTRSTTPVAEPAAPKEAEDTKPEKKSEEPSNPF